MLGRLDENNLGFSANLAYHSVKLLLIVDDLAFCDHQLGVVLLQAREIYLSFLETFGKVIDKLLAVDFGSEFISLPLRNDGLL